MFNALVQNDLQEILAVFRAAIKQLAKETNLNALYMAIEVYPRCMLMNKQKTIVELCYTPLTGYRYTINGGTTWCNNIMLADFIAKFLEDARRRLKRCKSIHGPCLIKRQVELKEKKGKMPQGEKDVTTSTGNFGAVGTTPTDMSEWFDHIAAMP